MKSMFDKFFSVNRTVLLKIIKISKSGPNLLDLKQIIMLSLVTFCRLNNYALCILDLKRN